MRSFLCVYFILTIDLLVRILRTLYNLMSDIGVRPGAKQQESLNA